jgi:hypothetical protein
MQNEKTPEERLGLDPKSIRRKEYKPEELKRDNWSNDEVLHLIHGMEFYYSAAEVEAHATTIDEGLEMEKKENAGTYAQAIEDVREIFEAFRAPEDSYYGPMAYDKKSGFRVYVGPRLPR